MATPTSAVRAMATLASRAWPNSTLGGTRRWTSRFTTARIAMWPCLSPSGPRRPASVRSPPRSRRSRARATTRPAPRGACRPRAGSSRSVRPGRPRRGRHHAGANQDQARANEHEAPLPQRQRPLQGVPTSLRPGASHRKRRRSPAPRRPGRGEARSDRARGRPPASHDRTERSVPSRSRARPVVRLATGPSAPTSPAWPTGAPVAPGRRRSRPSPPLRRTGGPTAPRSTRTPGPVRERGHSRRSA